MSGSEFKYEFLLRNMSESLEILHVTKKGSSDIDDFETYYVNNAYAELFGIEDRDEFCGKKYMDAWPLVDNKWPESIIEAYKEQKTVKLDVYSLQFRRYLKATIMPVPDDYVALIVQDSTEEKKIQNKLFKNKEELQESKNDLRALFAKSQLAEANICRKIAGDIHDNIGFQLTNIKCNIKNLLESEIISDTERNILSVSLEELDSITSAIRSMIFNISSPILYEIGLGAAISKMGNDFFAPKGIKFDYSSSIEDSDVGMNLSVMMYQVTKELFNNIVKHAHATNVIVRLRIKNGNLVLVVEDNGIGFASDNVATGIGDKKFGLISIREKLRYLSGSFDVYSGEGAGCIIRITVPLKAVD